MADISIDVSESIAITDALTLRRILANIMAAETEAPQEIYPKDPHVKQDFGVDWSQWLESGETITSSDWVIPSGIDQATPAPSINGAGNKTTIWLSGGVAGTIYLVANKITTSVDSRTDERTIGIHVLDR